MLSPFAKFRKTRDRKEAQFIVRKGLSFLEDNFQHKAMYEFQKALELDKETVAEYLTSQLELNLKENSYESALSIGVIVIKINKNDYELANKLGNCARKLNRYKQANNLYRQALRLNRKFSNALYNLAASMGRIPYYDNDVKLLVDRFDKITDFVLPGYLISPDFIENTKNRITREKNAEPEKQSQTEPAAKQILSKVEDETLPARKVENGIHSSGEPKYSEVCESIRHLIKQASTDLSIESKIVEFEAYVFNLGLYALSKKDPGLAQKCFLQLKNRKSKFEHLDMLITLAIYIENPDNNVMDHMMRLLAKDKTNRYINVNIGLLYRKRKNSLLSYKYLAIGALLLDKSNNIYCRTELMETADKEIEIGNLKKAFEIYKMLDSEIKNIHVKENIGQIHIYQNQYSDAIPFYKKILKMDPEYETAIQKLEEIHNHFTEKAEESFSVRKFANSVKLYEKALKACRIPETIKKTATVYHQLMDVKAEKTLMEEYRELRRQQKGKEKEQSRQSYIKKGKEYLLKKEYNKAFDSFDKALSMKVDKDVFVYLAHILKAQKRTAELKLLMERWKRMLQTQGISFDQI